MAGWSLFITGPRQMLAGCSVRQRCSSPVSSKKKWSWKTKREESWTSKGERPRRIFIYLIFYSLLLVRKTFMRVPLPCWCSWVFITASMKEKQTVLNLSDCCCGHGLYLLHFCLSHCFMVHLAELFTQNKVSDELHARNAVGRHWLAREGMGKGTLLSASLPTAS